ncbi:hypothetical protein [Micromonospora sp. DPT]|uniref:hypothetical protein n=1 Tax=Micromonospora sp. DPT TaxID=3142975 RepID=UPI0032093105
MTTVQRSVVVVTIVVTVLLVGLFAAIGLARANALAGSISAVLAVLALGLSVYLGTRTAEKSTAVISGSGSVTQMGEGQSEGNTGFIGRNSDFARIEIKDSGPIRQSGSDNRGNTGVQ